MKISHFLMFFALAFCFMQVESQSGQITIKSPKANDKIRYGKTVTVSWDTAGTYNRVLKFYWSESQSGPWNVLPLPKGKTELKDSSKPNIAVGSVNLTFPNKTTLWLKIEDKNDNTTNGSVGPLTIEVPTPAVVDETLQGTITTNKTLTSDKIWGLKGVVFVANGATLTIEPGTVILGEVGATSALCINRGGKIIADGTAQKPIVFTSGVVASSRERGDWGGLLIMGKAPTNLGEAPIEGGIADDASTKVNGWYGGSDPNDNSGILRYVRIEFAGIAESPDNELNGLTLGAVGAGTVIDHVQVSYANDDSFEWFGGTVNCKHLIAYNGIDDDFDTDNGYNGIVQFGISKRLTDVADISNSEAFESDNDASASEKQPYTNPLFTNMTVIGPMQDTSWVKGTGANTFHSRYLTAAQIRRNSRMGLANSVIFGYPGGLELTNNNTVRAAENDSVLVRYNDFYGIKDNKFFYFGSSTNPTATVTADWLKTATFGNVFANGSGNTGTLARITNAYGSGNTFDPTPASGAPYLTTAKYDHGRLTDALVEKVAYRGAIGATRWDAGWAEYDPVNKDYTLGVEDITDYWDLDIAISPNPAADYAALEYTLTDNESVTIRIVNANGIVVDYIVRDAFQESGSHILAINPENLNSGVYYIQVISSKGIATKHLTVIK